jgi:hypothetical protein
MPLTTEEQLHWIALTMLAARGQATPEQIMDLYLIITKQMENIARAMRDSQMKGAVTDANATARK